MKNTKLYVADFETTVQADTSQQDKTEVWSAALTEIGNTDPDNVYVWKSISDFMYSIVEMPYDKNIWFHNLSFDGSFILNYLLNSKEWKQAFDIVGDDYFPIPEKDMQNYTFKYTISLMGEWYVITLKAKNKIIRIYDSYKLLPLSVAKIGKAFKTSHQKLTMEYVGDRHENGLITDDEMSYIKNDVLVMSEALKLFFLQGHEGMTIGSCCLKDFKKKLTESFYKEYFPPLNEIELPDYLTDEYTFTADDFIRKSYKGGWCYLVKGKEGKRYYNGTTADVNSLYPSVMHSESGNPYPVGKPCFFKGDIPQLVLDNYYYFVQIETEFELKDGYLPCIQIKKNPLYKPTEWLETSHVYNKKTGKYNRYYLDWNGEKQIAKVTMVLSITDYNLIREHYNLINLNVIGGCYFATEIGLFDDYINEWRKVKEHSKDGMRTIAKLFLNNLYGKLASNDDSSFKVAYLNDNNALSFYTQVAHEKKLVSVACGAAVTSYARNFTIRAAQSNYHGKDKAGFIYADTDSIHCDLPPTEIKGIEVDDNAFLKWKLESCWDEAIFTRQKTYIEHITKENLQDVEAPYYEIKCAGMGKRCKELFNLSLQGITEIDGMTTDEQEFLSTPRTIDDFTIGLKIPSKLIAKQVEGGTLLCTTTFEMH